VEDVVGFHEVLPLELGVDGLAGGLLAEDLVVEVDFGVGEVGLVAGYEEKRELWGGEFYVVVVEVGGQLVGFVLVATTATL
jgi:hypothetical protein